MEWFFIGMMLLLGLSGLVAMANLSNTKSKFVDLGILAGKSEEEIILAVGAPSSVSAIGDGNKLLQWQHISEAGGYHIALLFDENNICLGVSHEFAS